MIPDDYPTPRSERTVFEMFRRAKVANPAWSLSLAAAACFGLGVFLKDGIDKLSITLGIVALLYGLIYLHFRRTGFLVGERRRSRRMQRRVDRAFDRLDGRR